ncbi:hypothetical protein [Psychroserpens sp.]|uniref:hypothetical protein n=1 Tax=Psychroserpens sp. TaxID=2020870 RepID=UPI0039E60EE3
MYRGINLGTGGIFVMLISDSIVTEDTLRNLVSPFENNDKCGAVAGNILWISLRYKGNTLGIFL